MSWPTVALGEVAKIERKSIAPLDIVSGSKYVGLEHIESGGASLSYGRVTNGELASNKFCFGPDHILFGKLRPYLAKIVCPDFEGICSTDILPIAPSKCVDRRYLLHVLRRPQSVDWAAARATGVNLPRLSPSELEALEVPLPPLDQQRRIAAILDQADALRRKRQRAFELLGSLTQSIFQEMFGRAQDFEVRPLATFADENDRINYGVVQPGDEEPDGINLVRVSDLKNGVVDHSNLRKVSKEISKKHGRSILKGNEILISCVGSIGEVAIASPKERGFNIARAVARVPITDNLQRLFVLEYLRSSTVQQYFTKELRTVSQPTLNIKQLSETLIPIPPTSALLEFQKRSDLVRNTSILARGYLAKSDILFASLQHRAFLEQL